MKKQATSIIFSVITTCMATADAVTEQHLWYPNSLHRVGGTSEPRKKINLKLKDGRAYADVKISEITASRITIQVADRTIHILRSQLDSESAQIINNTPPPKKPAPPVKVPGIIRRNS